MGNVSYKQWAMSLEITYTQIQIGKKKPERLKKNRIKYYYDNSSEGYFLEVDVEYLR